MALWWPWSKPESHDGVRCASVYERSGTVYVHSEAKTVPGYWIATEQVIVCRPGDDAGIAAAVLECLAASVQGVPAPPRHSVSDFLLLKPAKVRSYRAFVSGAKTLSVRLKDGRVTLTPMRNEGVRGGLSGLPDRALVVEPTLDALGAGVHEALARSE